jgi:hypothetical protein
MNDSSPPPTQRWSRPAALLIAGLISAGSILYGACASPAPGTVESPIGRALKRSRGLAELKKPSTPESVWNASRVWQRVGDHPATYIPRGYSASAPRGESHGRWFVDERDGKRLFVPSQGAGALSAGVLRGEAIKATLWHSRNSIPGCQEEPLRANLTL